MQNDINKIYNQVMKEIDRPASRPIKLMFFETPALYSFIQNKVKERFDSNEIININQFFDSKEWEESTNALARLENKFGTESPKFQRKLCQLLEEYMVRFTIENNPRKILIIEDSELYNNGFDPIHFLAAYMSEHFVVLEKEMPIIWITLGQKDEYDINEYSYFKSDTSSGRRIKVSQSNFRSCVFDYKLD